MANGLQGLFGGASGGGGASLFPGIFAALFGNGAQGNVTLGTIADAGYLGAFGAPQYTSVTLPSGATLTLPPGSSNGALLMACQGTVTIGGSIIANGAAGGTAVSGVSGAGGGTAGGGAGAAASTIATIGPSSQVNLNPGSVPTQFGHGCMPNTSRGAGAGVLGDGTVCAFNVSGDLGISALALIDVVNNVRCAPVPGASDLIVTQTGTPGQAAVTARSIPSNLLYAGNQLQPLGLLPTGLSGIAGGITALNVCASGGGGGGGGVIYIEANTIVFQAGHSIQAKGGNGGNGFTGPATGSTAQGGAGGDGGLVILVANQFVGTPNVSVAGGAAGTNAANTPTFPLAPPPASLAGRFAQIQL